MCGPYEVITNKQWLRDSEAAMKRCDNLQYPLFVKPARAGSSVGITKVDDPSELRAAIEIARAEDPKVIIEQAVSSGGKSNAAFLKAAAADHRALHCQEKLRWRTTCTPSMISKPSTLMEP